MHMKKLKWVENLLKLLIAAGFNVGKSGADGIMGNATQRALNEARALGYVLQKDGTWKLTKGIPYQSKERNTTLAVQNIVDSQSWNTKKLPKTWQPSEHVIQTFVKAAKTLPEVLYPQMAENMREYEENQKLTNQIANKVNSLAKKGVDKAKNSKIVEDLKRTPEYRQTKHAVQTFKNAKNELINNYNNDEFLKMLLTAGGVPVDITSSGLTSFLGATMYSMPIKDIITSAYNRIGRNITKDSNYTPIKGQIYDKYDYSPKTYAVIQEMKTRVNNGEDARAVADDIAKRVNPSYDYTNSSLLLHPFSPEANMLWTVGRVGPNAKYDTYDNAASKTESYKKSMESGWKDDSSIGRQLTRYPRYYGGLVTSQDTEPDEQKQKTIL